MMIIFCLQNFVEQRTTIKNTCHHHYDPGKQMKKITRTAFIHFIRKTTTHYSWTTTTKITRHIEQNKKFFFTLIQNISWISRWTNDGFRANKIIIIVVFYFINERCLAKQTFSLQKMKERVIYQYSTHTESNLTIKLS